MNTVIAGCSSVQTVSLPRCLPCSRCLSLFCVPPGPPFLCLRSPSLCLMFAVSSSPSSLSLLCHSNLSEPCTSSFFLTHFSLYLLSVFFPPRCLRWESVFCYVVGDGSRRLDPANVRLPETPEDGEHLAAEWVGGGESCRNRKGLLMNVELVGGTFSRSPTIVPKGKITRRCVYCHYVYGLGHLIYSIKMLIGNIEISHLQAFGVS